MNFHLHSVPRFRLDGTKYQSTGLGMRRHMAERAYDAALAQLGADHPATHAALGRFVALVGERFPELYDEPIPEGSEAFDRALFRESGNYGMKNRRMRDHEKSTDHARSA